MAPVYISVYIGREDACPPPRSGAEDSLPLGHRYPAETFAPWCNGSTPRSGRGSRGSSPWGAALHAERARRSPDRRTGPGHYRRWSLKLTVPLLQGPEPGVPSSPSGASTLAVPETAVEDVNLKLCL